MYVSLKTDIILTPASHKRNVYFVATGKFHILKRLFSPPGFKINKKILSSFKVTTSFLPLTIPPLYKSCRQESYQEIESRVIIYLLLRLSTKSWPNIWSVVEGNNIVPIEHYIKYFHLFPAEFGRLGGVVQRRLGVVLQRRLGVVLQRRGRG